MKGRGLWEAKLTSMLNGKMWMREKMKSENYPAAVNHKLAPSSVRFVDRQVI